MRLSGTGTSLALILCVAMAGAGLSLVSAKSAASTTESPAVLSTPSPRPPLASQKVQPTVAPIIRNEPPRSHLKSASAGRKSSSPAEPRQATAPVQVSGFITRNGNIYEVEGKDSIGAIEARQTGSSDNNEHIVCNYGSVVVYSDVPCDQVTNIQVSDVQPAAAPQSLEEENANGGLQANDPHRAEDQDQNEDADEDEDEDDDDDEEGLDWQRPNRRNQNRRRNNNVANRRRQQANQSRGQQGPNRRFANRNGNGNRRRNGNRKRQQAQRRRNPDWEEQRRRRQRRRRQQLQQQQRWEDEEDEDEDEEQQQQQRPYRRRNPARQQQQQQQQRQRRRRQGNGNGNRNGNRNQRRRQQEYNRGRTLDEAPKTPRIERAL